MGIVKWVILLNQQIEFFSSMGRDTYDRADKIEIREKKGNHSYCATSAELRENAAEYLENVTILREMLLFLENNTITKKRKTP